MADSRENKCNLASRKMHWSKELIDTAKILLLQQSMSIVKKHHHETGRSLDTDAWAMPTWNLYKLPTVSILYIHGVLYIIIYHSR